MTSRITLRRLLGATVALSLSFALFCWANQLAADVRYPLAFFCFTLSIAAFCVGMFLISRRLAAVTGRVVANVIEYLTW